MKNILVVIKLLFNFGILFLKNKMEKDVLKKQQKEEILKEGTDAIKNGDVNGVLDAFNRADRV